MKRFPQQRVIVLLFFLFYMISSQLLIPANNWEEIFPFFHWSLFSGSVDKKKFYRLKIERNKHTCYFPHCPEWKKINNKKNWFYIILKWGNQIEAGKLTKEQLLKKIKTRLLKDFPLPLKLSLVKIVSHPREFLENKTSAKEYIVFSRKLDSI